MHIKISFPFIRHRSLGMMESLLLRPPFVVGQNCTKISTYIEFILRVHANIFQLVWNHIECTKKCNVTKLNVKFYGKTNNTKKTHTHTIATKTNNRMGSGSRRNFGIFGCWENEYSYFCAFRWLMNKHTKKHIHHSFRFGLSLIPQFVKLIPNNTFLWLHLLFIHHPCHPEKQFRTKCIPMWYRYFFLFCFVWINKTQIVNKTKKIRERLENVDKYPGKQTV